MFEDAIAVAIVRRPCADITAFLPGMAENVLIGVLTSFLRRQIEALHLSLLL